MHNLSAHKHVRRVIIEIDIADNIVSECTSGVFKLSVLGAHIIHVYSKCIDECRTAPAKIILHIKHNGPSAVRLNRPKPYRASSRACSRSSVLSS
jgi:hypothetical protein